MIRRLFTPWRLKYLVNPEERAVCIFCRAAEADEDRAVWVLYRGQHAFVMLNIYPYSSGHVMIAPYHHWASPTDAPREVLHEMADLTRDTLSILHRVYRPDGFNTGMNIGRAAGAGFADHFHLHIVPRWEGDTNFMTTIGETRLIPESIEKTYERLRPLFDSLKPVNASNGRID